MINLLLTGLVYVWIYMTFWFVVAIITRRNDVADLAWGLGFVGVAWLMFGRNGHFLSFLMAGLVTVWGLRLAVHIGKRLKRKPEDSRYAQWRKDWGRYFYLRSYFQVFLLQGILMWLISASLIVAADNLDQNLGITIWLGVGVWLLGFVFESIADKQLSKFVGNPQNKGQIMQTGLWRYSRHPNYFGEITMWWGLWMMTIPYYFLLALLSPITITFLITKVSGVPLLERKYEGRKDWEEYKRKTSVLIPWYKPGK